MIHSRPTRKAGKGNRTLIASLEGWSFTIKLCPRAPKLPRSDAVAKFFQNREQRMPSVCATVFVDEISDRSVRAKFRELANRATSD